MHQVVPLHELHTYAYIHAFIGALFMPSFRMLTCTYAYTCTHTHKIHTYIHAHTCTQIGQLREVNPFVQVSVGESNVMRTKVVYYRQLEVVQVRDSIHTCTCRHMYTYAELFTWISSMPCAHTWQRTCIHTFKCTNWALPHSDTLTVCCCCSTKALTLFLHVAPPQEDGVTYDNVATYDDKVCKTSPYACTSVHAYIQVAHFWSPLRACVSVCACTYTTDWIPFQAIFTMDQNWSKHP
jgi:hypothetical protein